jgi:glycosyltransferase involved in cell wall biosynthesis
MNISFFIPAYNCATTLAESVDSIMETNFTAGDELIIVNDCSTDNTGEILKEVQIKYPGVSVLNHIRNKGGAAARNTAVEQAKHDLLFCLDADNVLLRSSIAPLKEYLISNNADIASFQHQHFFEDDKLTPLYTWSLPPGELSLQIYLGGGNTPGQHGNYLFTKKSWIKAKGYAEGCSLDTWTFGLRQAITGAKTIVLKDMGYYHRLSPDSYWMRECEPCLWANSLKSAIALFPFFNIIEEGFLSYMLGKGKYKWYYTLKTKPIKLVEPGDKELFYSKMQLKTKAIVYPRLSVTKKAFGKLKRMFFINDNG